MLTVVRPGLRLADARSDSRTPARSTGTAFASPRVTTWQQSGSALVVRIGSIEKHIGSGDSPKVCSRPAARRQSTGNGGSLARARVGNLWRVVRCLQPLPPSAELSVVIGRPSPDAAKRGTSGGLPRRGEKPVIIGGFRHGGENPVTIQLFGGGQ